MTLVEHARRELDALGEDPWIKNGMLNVIQTFADMGHSGSSAEHCIDLLEKLLRFQNLTPLTDNPSEWMHVANDIYQSRRCSEAFSNDGGKTYYLLSEGASDQNREPLHESVRIERV